MSRSPLPSRTSFRGTGLAPGWVPQGRHIDLVGGGRAFVRTAGRDRGELPIVLLHGLGATAALNWARTYEPLARRTEVIAVDHRGHGRGPRVGNRFRLEDCADDVADVLRTLGHERAIVAGYSMGGPIAQLMALRHPELVAGLILAATARDFRGAPSDRIRFAAVSSAAAAARWGPSALWPALTPVLPGRLRPLSWAMAELRRHEPAALLAAAAELGHFTSRSWIHELQVPAAVIVHERDGLVPARRQWKLAEALPEAEVVRLDADHLAITRAPVAFGRALLQAHASVDGRAVNPQSSAA